MTSRFEVVVVGLGPAGLAAAVELAKAGVRVALVDENPAPGGQVYRQNPPEFRLTDSRFLDFRHRAGQALIDSFNSIRDQVEVLTETLAWGLFDDAGLALQKNNRLDLLEFDKLILAEGAMERSVPFPGWTLPGVMTAGGLQRLLVNQGLLPGKRFVLAGASPLLITVAASLIRAGGQLAALCEATSFWENLKLVPAMIRQGHLFRETASCLSAVWKKRVPVLRGQAIVAARGDERVREVTVARLDDDWQPVPGSEKNLEADIVAVSYGFLPLARLTRLAGCQQVYDPVQKSWRPQVDQFMLTSEPNVYAAGDSAGIGGADLAELEGRIAAVHAARDLGRLKAGEAEAKLAGLFEKKNSLARWSRSLDRVFQLRPGLFEIITGETVVCRCEQVRAEEVFRGLDLGYRNINEIKRTRVGMGPCQGRTCEAVVAELMRQRGLSPEEIGFISTRPPTTPIQLSVFRDQAARSASA
ncbi:MAG: FAD-dependent oxidoreductase [Deltaproteobacteria bacterium]|nr:FAD-dependent oxidoreductase [Deltaproteobacteria bacterium]